MPAQPSPAAGRIARVLEVLASQPTTAFSLSEIARQAGLNRASCQTLLLGLVAEGFVRRHEVGPTYQLGPALIHIGEAARASLDVIDIVEPELDALRDRFEANAIACTTAGDEVVVLAARPFAHPHGYSITAGTRLPLAAPIGPIYVAWADQGAIDRWLAGGPNLAPARRARATAELEAIRTRGWSATIRSEPSGNRTRSETREVDDDDLRSRKLHVIGVSAPVWDQRGEMPCVLALAAFPADVTGAQLREIGAGTKAAADRVSAHLGYNGTERARGSGGEADRLR